ncbi:hypothetical protein CRE_02346 [Caenorhabditis remanei]|uniref:Uncharacterized protein n=1 Tax=Caenorhabditis remanei TaxID=31234 RepID=E3MIL7_CAERE|nr:hypothetical protein CRE_02346 [Caenorhabditis remanei]
MFASLLKVLIVGCLLVSATLGIPSSNLKSLTAIYCPHEINWSWRAMLIGSDDGTNGKQWARNEGGGYEQLQFIEMGNVVNDPPSPDEIELEIWIEHTCNVDAANWKKLEADSELIFPLGKGDIYAFKALHLGKENKP